jgi:DNA-binding CsgD family transcriptional regulator
VTGLSPSSLFGQSVRRWPLIGRESERRQIAGARLGMAPGVVVLAPAGVGKSRLAREALAQAERDGALTVWVQATRSAASVPLGAFAGVLPAEVRSDDLFELLRGSAAALRGLAGDRPLVVGVDDAQLLDPVSAALVLHLASAAATFVLATVRTGEPCPDAIVSLWKDAGAQRLELAALSDRETDEMVESIVGGPVEEGTLHWAWETSRGNPLYVRELVLGALGGAALAQVSGLWRMPARPPISASLTELISARMAGLADGERRVLELLALGEPLTVDALVELVGVDAVVSTEARGLVSIDAAHTGQQTRLSHPLYGEAIRSSLPSLRAREIRLTLADCIQAQAELAAEDSLRAARLLLDAGASVPTRLLIDAARSANLSGDPDLGAELSARALGAGGGAEAGLLLARAEQVRKRFAEAESVLAELEGKFEAQETAIAYLDQRVPVLYWGLKRPAEAQELLARAQAWWPERSWLRRLDPMRLHLASMLEGPAGVVAVAGEILADAALDEDVRRGLEPVYAVNLFYSGRTSEANELIRRLRPTLPIASHTAEIALIGATMIPLESGEDLRGLKRDARTLLDEGVGAGDQSAAGVGAAALGAIAFLAGRYREAERWLAQAELHFEQRDTWGMLLIIWATQAGVARFTADDTALVGAVKRCDDALHGEDPLPNQLPYVVRARAWAADARGDRPAAQRMLLDTAEAMSGMPVYAAQLRYEAMRCGTAPRGVAAALRTVCDVCDAPLVAAYAEHAAARAAGSGAALLKAADEFEQIGTLRYATEAAADAARAFLEAGRQDSARRAAARSRELLIDGQGATLPPIEGLDGPAVELTAREAQLVELARQGLTNPQIADRLVLSVRTVESHLYRAMQKLGISDRRQL